VNASVIGWPVKKSTFAQFNSVHFCSDHYTPLARASVERGVKVVITWKHREQMG